jgi:KUP system potassium uptake protein
VLLATMATVIASQALITGAFSVTKQAIQLGYLPRLRICTPACARPGRSTCRSSTGVCLPAIVLAVVLFGSSASWPAAYGIAVTLDMLITTVMTFFVIRYSWKYPLWLCVAATGVLLSVDLAFFAPTCGQAVRRRLVPAGHRCGDVHADDDLEEGRAAQPTAARRSHRPAGFLEAVFVSPPCARGAARRCS